MLITNKNKIGTRHCPDLLYFFEFVILESQTIAHINAVGQQGDGDLGNHAAIVVFYEGVISTDINDGAVHMPTSL